MSPAGPSERPRPARAKQRDTQRPKDSAATRDEIIRAAAQRFAERGYAQVTLQEIADDAGVTPALVNRYFVSKRALFELVAQSQFGLIEPENGIGDFADRLMAFWKDTDRRTPALAVVRSIDLDGGKVLRQELERRLRTPWRAILADDAQAEAKMRLLESLTMGLGLFGFRTLTGETDQDPSPEVAAAMAERLARMIEACLND